MSVQSGLIKITSKDTEIFRIIQAYLNDKNINYYSIPPKGQRPLKYIIRNLPDDFSIDVLKTEIQNHNVTIKNIHQLRSLKEGHKLLPIYFVTINNNENNKRNFTNINSILNMNIKIEPHKSKGFQQCYRCQRYNHNSENCHLIPRCLKCGENHLTRACPKSKDTPAKCCNCGDPHPANYSNCPKNPDVIKATRALNQQPPKAEPKNSSQPRCQPPTHGTPNPLISLRLPTKTRERPEPPLPLQHPQEMRAILISVESAHSFNCSITRLLKICLTSYLKLQNFYNPTKVGLTKYST